MPSNTAFVGDLGELPAGKQLASAYDDLGDTVGQYPRVPSRVEMFPVTPRALTSTIQNLRALGLDIDENNRMLRALQTGIITGYSLTMLYRGVALLRRAQQTRQTILAAAETTAMAIAQQWDKIAMASAAAIMTYAAFKAGEKFGSGDWNLPSFNLGDPLRRRRGMRQLSELNG